MVIVSIDNSGFNGHILLEPNLSLSWKANTRLFVIFALITLLIAGYFTIQGFWMVLPFSGIELLIIGISLYLFFRRNNHREVITFTPDKVVIERGRHSPEISCEYQRYWSKIYVQKQGMLDIPHVSIKSHGMETELGAFLGYEEKLRFIEILKNITHKFQTYC